VKGGEREWVRGSQTYYFVKMVCILGELDNYIEDNSAKKQNVVKSSLGTAAAECEVPHIHFYYLFFFFVSFSSFVSSFYSLCFNIHYTYHN
jgi:hypothetical protein